MPNWCMNELVVSGVDIQEFKDKTYNEDCEFSFQKFFPLPEDKEDEWYDWQTSNWGCKWDVSESFDNSDGDILIIFFSTAWSPPEGAISKLSEIMPEACIKLSFYEGGCGFAGVAEFDNGGLSSLVEYDSGNNDYYRFIFDNGFEEEDMYAKTEHSYLFYGDNCISDCGEYIMYHSEYGECGVNKEVYCTINDINNNYVKHTVAVYNGKGHSVELSDGKVVKFGS